MEQHGRWDVFIGIAAEDKIYNSRLLKIYLPELLSMFQGELKDLTSEEVITITDPKTQKKETIKLDTSNTIVAEYLGLFTNRVTPPDIRKGEQVIVFRYSDNDIFYWLPLGRDDYLRTLEHMRLFICDTQERIKELTDDNMYYIEMDSLYSKTITIRTSKSDGEKFRYIIQIDAEKNQVLISDDDDNYIILQSDIPRIKLHNKNNSYVDINQDDIFIHAPRDVRIKAGRMILEEDETHVVKSSKADITEANNITLKASNIVSEGSTIGLNGTTKIAGFLAVDGVRSSSYSTGGVGGAYTAADANTDINVGSSTTPSPSPDGDAGSNNRHCAAWEEVQEALNIIYDCLSIIDSKLGIGCGYGSLPSLASQSKMNKNRGE